MDIIDTHCHLDFEAFDGDRNSVLESARSKGVCGFVIPGVKQSTWSSLIDLCGHSPDMFYALGMHPMFISDHIDEHVEDLKSMIHSSHPIAVGEIGLDFYEKHSNKEAQIALFERQLEVACKVNLPVILHVRKAHEEVLNALDKYPVRGGVVHAFNGSLQQAERYQAHQFVFGFGGMLTYSRSTKLRSLAQALPLSAIVLETDSPDMTVEQHRGERNSPEYLSYCLQALAEIKSLSQDEVAAATTDNVHHVFNLMY